MPIKDPEKKREYLRQWRLRNPEKQTDINRRRGPKEKAYRQARTARYAELQRQWRAEHPRDNLVILARARAKRGGLPFDITAADIEWPTHCPVFGIEIDYNSTPTGQRKHAKRDAFATLDKKIPELGYVKGNVFVLSYKANRLKQDASHGQLAAIMDYMRG